jgi:hypothetical protein
MRNRIEVPLSNYTFGDATAWRAIRNAERAASHKSLFGENPEVKIGNLQNERITGLNQQLGELRKQKNQGLITPSEYRMVQKELATQLHEQMRKAGHKPIRTKVNPPLTR